MPGDADLHAYKALSRISTMRHTVLEAIQG
jgi:hypothetical protein